MKTLFGHGSMEKRLTPKDVKDICEAALADLPLDGKARARAHP